MVRTDCILSTVLCLEHSPEFKVNPPYDYSIIIVHISNFNNFVRID